MISMRRHLSKNRPGLPQISLENPCNEGEGTQYPAAQKLNGVVAPVAFYEVVAATTVHGQDRCVRGSSHSSLSVSVLRLWLRDSSITASSRLRAVGVTAPLHFYDGFDAVLPRRRSNRDNGSFSTVLFSVFSLCDALLRFTALSGHWPFAGDSGASGCQPMPLRDASPEWAYSLF